MTHERKKTKLHKNFENFICHSRRSFKGFEARADKDFYDYLSDGKTYAGLENLVSERISLGFDYKVNERTYRDFSIAMAGWLILHDPNDSKTSALEDVFQAIGFMPMPPYTAYPTFNDAILDRFLNYDHILIAPWFDTNSTTFSSMQAVHDSAKFSTTLQIVQDVKSGKDDRSWPFDEKDYGVRYGRFYDKRYGRYVAVRWTVSQFGFKNRLKFEACIFENGRIEFRYWPLTTYEPPIMYADPSTATCGIFWSGANIGSNRFRDFSPLLDYKKEERQLSERGGAEYSSTFFEDTPTPHLPDNLSSKPYVHQLPVDNWPKNGAVIVFSPPVSSMKSLPRKMTRDISSKLLTKETGLYDDRKTMNFSSNVTVHMPSTIHSRLIGDTGDIDVAMRQALFTSGSLQVNGNVKQSSVDNLLEQIEAIENSENFFDFSFNEQQKNYDVFNLKDPFFATGSSLELFGPSFTSPLKSKTKFDFSFPVTKKSSMPSDSPGVYYFDFNRNQWMMVAQNSYSKVLPWSPSNTDANPLSSSTGGFFSYRVAETSRMFDAVGRKIVSGSNHIVYYSTSSLGVPSTPLGEVSDASIGAIYNVSKQDSLFKNSILESTTKSYKNSSTDSESFFPLEGQSFLFSNDLDAPFLLEKVVVDFPIELGNSWFSDVTTCGRAFGGPGPMSGTAVGPFDFGGPGITFSLLCSKRASKNASYIDLIASGTITHEFDMKFPDLPISLGKVKIYKDSGMNDYNIRPIGFNRFSNPTCVISGTLISAGRYEFTGSVKLKMEAAVSSGMTFAREFRSPNRETSSHVLSNKNKVYELLRSPFISQDVFDHYLDATLGKDRGGNRFFASIPASSYSNRTSRVYIQQISPLSRGSSKLEFNGNSPLGSFSGYFSGSIYKNQLYSLKNNIVISAFGSLTFTFMAYSMMSSFTSKPSPYLLQPGDKITLCMSKTRPIVYKALHASLGDVYDSYILTGSHDVTLSTGSINMTFYGSYIREGEEYNP
jgi:hypothetical protein